MSKMEWKTGRGKLGVFKPLLGKWACSMDSVRGPFVVTRSMKKVLNDKYVLFKADWVFGEPQNPSTHYVEHAYFGVEDGELSFKSFTSDGKQSAGRLAFADDMAGPSLCFEADMPAGRARMIWMPHYEGGLLWAVENQTKKGWNRFSEHQYLKLDI